MAQKVDIVLFDLGKVVVDFDTSRIVTELAGRTKKSPEDIARAISTEPLYHDFERGRITAADFHRALQHTLGLVVSFNEFLPIWNNIFTQKPDMEQLVRETKRRFRIAALSNTNELHWNYLRQQFRIMHSFDDYFLSHTLHTRKPEEKIFNAVLAYYGLAPNRIAYFDDVPEYTAAARERGILAHVFTTVEEARALINEL